MAAIAATSFDFLFVQQPLLMSPHPRFLFGFIVGMEFADQLPWVLACGIEIDNLHRAGKVLLGKVPDPFRAVVTVAELVHGIYRATTPKVGQRRREYIEEL